MIIALQTLENQQLLKGHCLEMSGNTIEMRVIFEARATASQRKERRKIACSVRNFWPLTGMASHIDGTIILE